MQRIPGRVFVAVALITLVSAACGDSPSAVPRGDATVELTVGQSAVIGGLEITLVSVDEDSRCPEDVLCVWSGDATVALVARTASNRQSLRLHTDVEPRAESFANRRIVLVGLAPRPREGDPIPQSAYRATVRVERAG